MKQTIAAVLTLIMCLALCACSGVKQEVYDAAMSSYEAAKAGYDDLAAKYDALKEKVEKYSTVIDALEKEDYDGAVEAVNAMRPAPEVTAVEITMDNFWDYFEIVEEKNNEFDARGNQQSSAIIYCLSLKSEFELASLSEYPSTVAVDYEYDRFAETYSIPCTMDFDMWTCDASPKSSGTFHESDTTHFPNGHLYESMIMAFPKLPSAVIQTCDNLVVLYASGTLYLVNK